MVVRSARSTVDDEQFRRFVGELARAARETGGVRNAVTYVDTAERSLVSADRHATLIPIDITDDTAAGGDLVMFQQMGFGIAVSLLIDATVIRSVVLPSVMVLLGDRNWYLPRWLTWIPHLEVEGHHEAEPEPRPA